MIATAHPDGFAVSEYNNARLRGFPRSRHVNSSGSLAIIGRESVATLVAAEQLFLVTHQFSLLVPDLQAMPVNYIVIWAQRFGGFERQFERLKRLHGMATVGRDAKRSV
jgi:hypothetical protein